MSEYIKESMFIIMTIFVKNFIKALFDIKYNLVSLLFILFIVLHYTSIQCEFGIGLRHTILFGLSCISSFMIWISWKYAKFNREMDEVLTNKDEEHF